MTMNKHIPNCLSNNYVSRRLSNLNTRVTVDGKSVTHFRGTIKRLLDTKSKTTLFRDRKTNWCSCSMKTKLPNGWEVSYVSEPDVPFLYNEIFVEECYTQHGVKLEDNDVVLDIGANIGLFGMFCGARVGPGGRVLCCEPVPVTFSALQDNLAALPKLLPAHHQGAAKLTPLNIAVSNGAASQGEMVFYSDAAGWSTLTPNDSEVASSVEAYVLGSLGSGAQGLQGGSPLVALGAWLADLPGTTPLIKFLTRVKVAQMLSSKTTVACKLQTVSEIIASEALPVVNLLKIDVERAELEVLQGIQPADWPKIQQVVMEVHDFDGNLDNICSMLKVNGFSFLICEQPDLMKETNLWNVYAHRHNTSE